MKNVGWLVPAALGSLILALSPAIAADPTGFAAWYAAYQQDSRLVQIPGGRALNLYCVGAGSRTVILESGLGGGAYDWRAVQGKIAKLTRVCAYDRAGYGKSPPGAFPRETRAQVADLEALLRAARIRGPYILVGHSMGGYIVRVFASRHPRDVAGMVLVDPSVENQLPIIESVTPAIVKNDQRSFEFARRCADRNRKTKVADSCTRSAPSDFPPDLVAAFAATQGLTTSQTFQSEIESFEIASQQVAAEWRHFGSIPLIVLTRGELSSDIPANEADLEWKLWNAMHNVIAKLSTAGVNRVVKGANHYIQLDKPDAVVDAVVEVLTAAQRRPIDHRH